MQTDNGAEDLEKGYENREPEESRTAERGGHNLLDDIFREVPAGIVYMDERLRILRLNPLGARAIGVEASSVGQSFMEVAEETVRDALAPLIRSVVATRKPATAWGSPVSYRRKSSDSSKATAGDPLPEGESETFYWDFTVRPLQTSSSSSRAGTSAGDTGILLFAVNMTARVHAEQAMRRAIEAERQSADKLGTVFEHMSDGVLLCDTEGQPQFVNPAARQLLNLSDESADLEHLFDEAGGNPLLVKADGSAFTESSLPWQRACTAEEESRNEEIQVRRREGDEITISVDSTPLRDDRNELIGAVSVFRDVTENRRLINELRDANRRLEEFNRLKAEFVANMSHELRTPLTAIIGFTQLMEMRAVQEQLPVAFTDPIERVLRNSRHLLSLIDDVLDMSKIEAGRIAVHPETFDLVELVQTVFGELAGLAKRKGLEYRLNVRDEFPLAFNDPVRVRQILLNLLSNAIKFTPHGSIEAELRRTDENEWQLTVSDTGVGIRKESLGFIFERFRQVDGSMTRREGGTGLGLSIVQQLVTLLGGRVEVTSEYGAGSTFTVHLPLFAMSEKSLDSLALHSLEGLGLVAREGTDEARMGSDDRRSLILIIEDDTDARALLSETLERAGYRVASAADGPAGLKMARELLPTAVTLDIMMPSVDGWRVLQAMKADTQTANIPVIVCSIVDNRPLGYRLGASDYLVKPVKQQDLLQALRNVGAGDEKGDKYVLVVDDERGVRELLVEALRKAGFNAQGAPSGEVALSLSIQRTPQAVLCDLMMPGMSGFELIARMRTNEATAQTPVIVITSKDVTAEDRKLMSGQIADVIRKGDLLMPDLESRLRDTLEEIGVKPSDGEDTAG